MAEETQGHVEREIPTGTIEEGQSEAAKKGLEQIASEDAQGKSQEGSTESTFDVPEKFLGEDGQPDLGKIVQAQQDAEQKYSKLANDLRTRDDLIMQLNTVLLEKKGGNVETDDSVDTDLWFENPKAATEKLLDDRDRRTQDSQSKNQTALNAKLVSWQEEYGGDHMIALQTTEAKQEFAEWIKASPYRTKLVRAVDDKQDFEAAAELSIGWKEVWNSKGAGDKQAAKDKTKADLKAASTVSGGKSAAPKGGKIFSAHEVRKLIRDDPKTYNDPDFQMELMQAYQEGRVR